MGTIAEVSGVDLVSVHTYFTDVTISLMSQNTEYRKDYVYETLCLLYLLF